MKSIESEFDNFFEFPTQDKSMVSSVSCKLFARHITNLVMEECAKVAENYPRAGGWVADEIAAAIRAAAHLSQQEAGK